MKFLSCISFIFLTLTSFAQSSGTLEERELRLDSLLTSLREADNNNDRKNLNLIFKAEMESFVENQGALDYEFTKLPTVGVIDSPDKLVRIINWNVEQEDLSHEYFCFVLHYDKKKKKYKYAEMKDLSFGMPSQPTELVTQDNWYGALYYKIIPIKKGSRTMYTLLGWDHNSPLSQLKIIDVMYFSGSTVKLGSPVFKIGKKSQYRVFYEYSKKATMYLNYETDRKRIMMDHLSPEAPSLKNFRSYYVPDLSYDAFIYENNKWVLKEDVIGVNHSEGAERGVIAQNEETGLLERVNLENEWQNPEDANAPVAGSSHVAVTPDELAEEEEKKKKVEGNPLDKRVKKRDKRDPNDMSTFNDGKRKRKRKKKKWWKKN